MIQTVCTLPHWAKVSGHQCTKEEFHCIALNDKHLKRGICEYTVSGPSKAFSRKTVVQYTFFALPQSIAKQVFGLTLAEFARILCFNQPIHTSLSIWCNFEEHLQRFKHKQNIASSFKNWPWFSFNESDPIMKMRYSRPRELKIKSVVPVRKKLGS